MLCRRVDSRSDGSFLREFEFALLRCRLRFLDPPDVFPVPALGFFDFGAFRSRHLRVLLRFLGFPLTSGVVYGIEELLRLHSHGSFIIRLIHASFYLARVVSGYPVHRGSVFSDRVSARSSVSRGVIRTVATASDAAGSAGRTPSSAVSADSGDAISSCPLIRVVSAVSGASSGSGGRKASRRSGVSVRILRSGVGVSSSAPGSSGVSLAAAPAAASGQDVGVRSYRSSASSSAASEHVSGIGEVQRDAARERYGVAAVRSVVSVSVSSVSSRSVNAAVVYQVHHASGRKRSDGERRNGRGRCVDRDSSVDRHGRVERKGLVPSCGKRLGLEVVVGGVRPDGGRKSERSLRTRRGGPVSVPRVVGLAVRRAVRAGRRYRSVIAAHAELRIQDAVGRSRSKG